MAAAQVDDAAPQHEAPDGGPRVAGGSAAEEDADAAGAVAADDPLEDLDPRAVDGGDAVDVEDDVAVAGVVAEARQGRVGVVRAVELEPAEPVLELARVGERQGLGDLDDEAALDKLERVRVLLGVGEPRRARDPPQDLDPGPRRVPHHLQEGDTDPDGDP